MDDSPVISAPIGVDQVIAGTPNGCIYHGVCLRETAAAAVILQVRQGSATGKILGEVSLAASGTLDIYYAENGIWCDGQIYVEKVSGTGTVVGSVRYR